MRLSDVLSSEPKQEFDQIEGFLDNRMLRRDKSRKLKVGKIAINYFCHICNNQRTFWSEDEIYALGVDNQIISIDINLKCNCGNSIQVWFLLESKNKIYDYSPFVRILKRSERLGQNTSKSLARNEYSNFLDKSEIAYNSKLGIGAMSYLRIIYEKITIASAKEAGIEYKNSNGNRISFSKILKNVDEKISIIPDEFKKNRYKLFSEISEIIHGNLSDDEAMEKFPAVKRLITSIIDRAKEKIEIIKAMNDLQWETGDEVE